MAPKGFQAINYAALPLRRVGIGMLGYGFMGKVHSNAYLKIPYSFHEPAAYPELVAMCGRDEARVADVAARLRYRGYYTDWKLMLQDPNIEILDNCTPDDRHRDPSIAAAAAGKHVICEKPLAMTVRDAAAMLEAVTKAGVKHMCCFNYRFIPAVRLAKELLQSRAIGQVYHFRGCYLQEPGHDPASPVEDVWYASGTRSGILLGIGSHIIDMARFLLGEITSVSGLVRTWNTSRASRSGALETVTADEGNLALVEFASGATGTLESSGVATGHKNQHTWEINGSKGSICWDLEDPNHLLVYSDDAPLPSTRGFASVSVTTGAHPLQTMYLPPGHNAGWEYGHVHALYHFVDCVVNDEQVAPYGATFEDGYRVQVIMDAIERSSRTGQRIDLTY
ncbi:MAG: Gfo/Idh/MocA family oxidoreductase [Chloroflexi bacterium]|nr:Gfo/Idh/MocA family oxidoreductase [Chloroflexota bacterium]